MMPRRDPPSPRPAQDQGAVSPRDGTTAEEEGGPQGTALARGPVGRPSSSQGLARYRALLSAVSDAIFVADADTGLLLDANDKACDLLGLPLSLIMGRPHSSLYPMAESARSEALFRRCARGGAFRERGDTATFNVQRGDGATLPCEISAMLFEEENQRIVFGVFRDLRPRKQMEQILRESERRFRLLAENSPDPFFLHDMSGAILDVNQRACACLGYTEKELRGLYIWDVEVACPAETLKGFWRNLQLGSFHFDGLSRRRDGTTFPSEIQGLAFEERGRLLSLVAVRDVTARRQMEEHLRQARDQALAANRAKSDFLATMSHEIRTPLNIILGMAELLRESPDLAAREQVIGAIESSGQTLLRLISNILDLSRIEANMAEMHPAQVDPGALILRFGEAVRLVIEQKGLDFETSLAGDLPPQIEADPSLLQQVLLNLVWNAVKFTSRGRITLRARRKNAAAGTEALEISIEDTGIGIPADKLDCIFEPFTQADASIRRRHGGSGLGLAICKRLVELMGGEIHVASEEGRGSRFSVSLPLVFPSGRSGTNEPPAEEEPASCASGDAVTRRILLVEDSLSNQELMRLFLESEPYELRAASSGREALECVAGQAFDCILMDVQMPEMDGFETTAAIRRLERETGAPPAPIVFLTAHALSEYRQQGIEAGGDGFLSKPIRKKTLLQELRRVWGTPRP